MSLTLLAALMAALLVVTVASAIWRCSHPLPDALQALRARAQAPHGHLPPATPPPRMTGADDRPPRPAIPIIVESRNRPGSVRLCP